MAANRADPELLRYRDRIDQQLAARRNGKSGSGLAFAATPRAASFNWQRLLVWIAPIAVGGPAAFAGWWVASAPATRSVTLATAVAELEVQGAAPADKGGQEQERAVLQKALQQSETVAASLAQSLAEERFRNHELERQLAARPEETSASTSIPTAARTGNDPSSQTADPELLRLLSRAALLIAQGDIGGARVVLERAAETGSASALFALAETFDPAILAAWGTVGTQGDPAWARELYAKAAAGGIAAATERLAALKQ